MTNKIPEIGKKYKAKIDTNFLKAGSIIKVESISIVVSRQSIYFKFDYEGNNGGFRHCGISEEGFWNQFEEFIDDSELQKENKMQIAVKRLKAELDYMGRNLQKSFKDYENKSNIKIHENVDELFKSLDQEEKPKSQEKDEIGGEIMTEMNKRKLLIGKYRHIPDENCKEYGVVNAMPIIQEDGKVLWCIHPVYIHKNLQQTALAPVFYITDEYFIKNFEKEKK